MSDNQTADQFAMAKAELAVRNALDKDIDGFLYAAPSYAKLVFAEALTAGDTIVPHRSIIDDAFKFAEKLVQHIRGDEKNTRSDRILTVYAEVKLAKAAHDNLARSKSSRIRNACIG